MTTYIVPCGVSMLNGLRRSRGNTGGGDPDGLVAAAPDWAAYARQATDDQAGAAWTDRVRAAVAEAYLPGWQPRVCAELSSLASRRPALSTLTADGHTVVVLASDTDLGLGAAMIVATWLSPAAGYVTVPDDPGLDLWRYRFATGTVTVARIRGLDPRSPDGTGAATAGIGRALRAAFDSAGGGEVEVHLTGGLKSTLLYLMAMSEVLGSLPGAHVTAWYLYDDETDDPAGAPLVQVGLRRFEEEHLDEMRAELGLVRDGKPTAGTAFRGVGWVEAPGGYRITGFGNGFLAVLGQPAADSVVGCDGLRA